MDLFPEFKEWLGLLNKHRVEYLVVGAHAVAFHGAPRFTGDLDVWVHATRENADKVVAALAEFGFASLGLGRGDFEAPGNVIQLGLPPVRIDLATSLTGVQWEKAWASRTAGELGGCEVPFIGRESLLQNKAATGRKKDLSDIEALGG